MKYYIAIKVEYIFLDQLVDVVKIFKFSVFLQLYYGYFLKYNIIDIIKSIFHRHFLILNATLID